MIVERALTKSNKDKKQRTATKNKANKTKISNCIGRNREKKNIAIALLGKKQFDSITNISHFGGTNNTFVDSTNISLKYIVANIN